MLKMVDGTGIIGVDMICPLGVSTPQPPNYDRVELEGAGMLVLPNSLNAPLERLELGGKTEQVQTTGAQLLKPKDGSYTVFGVSVDIANGEIKLSGTATSSGGRTIRLSEPFLLKAGTYSSEVDGKIDFILSKNSDNSCLTNLAVKNFNVNEDTEVYVGLNVMAQNTYNNKYHIMLNSGNIPLPYEPYTGGKPSPSPEYPQEIKNVGKWNGEKQKYEVDVKITGKNLFDIEKASEKANWTQHNNFPGYYNFPVFVGKDNTVTISIPQKIPTGQGLFLSVCLSESGGREGWIAHNSNASLNNAKLTYKATTDYIYLNAHSDTIAGMERFFGELQIECGNVATPYQPYTEQSLTLTSDRPLTKWDKLVEQDGQIGWLYSTKKYIVTGQELFETKPSYVMEETVDFSFMNNKQSGIRKATDNFCNRLTFVDSVWSKRDIGFGISGSEVHIRLSLDTIGATKTDESEIIKNKFTEYLSKKYSDGEPFAFWHKSKTQEFVPLPQSEQDAVRNLRTYYPTTVITVDGGELDPDIKVTYRKEI